MGWEHLPARVQGWARGRDGPGACSAVWSHRARLPDGQMAHSESHANMSVLVLAALWQTPAGPLRGTLWRPGKDRKWDGPKKAAGQAKSRHTLAGPPRRPDTQAAPPTQPRARPGPRRGYPQPCAQTPTRFQGRVYFHRSELAARRHDPGGLGVQAAGGVGPEGPSTRSGRSPRSAQRNAQPRGDAALCAGSNGGTERPWKPRAGPRPRTRRALAREDLRGDRGRQSRGRPGAAAPTCRDPAAGTGPPARRGTPGSGG